MPMPKSRGSFQVEVIEWYPVQGDWGAQIGWTDARIAGVIPPSGIVIQRLPTFRQHDGNILFGAPLLDGIYPGSRHSGIVFPDEQFRRNFFDRLRAQLLAAHPELARESQP
jgi:hypothetical protein